MDQQKEPVVSKDAKKPYEKPEVAELGSVEKMTQAPAQPGGSQIDGILNTSDRNLKENFAAVDAHVVLEKLAQVRISTWNYKTDSHTVRHIGPMAQDFAKAFGVGDCDRVIHNVDSGGVTMAAVQALYQMVLEQNQRIAALDAQVRELREAAVAV